jgi:cytidylate kinase
MIIALDGPAGAGKSTVARAAADARLRLHRRRGDVPRLALAAGSAPPGELRISS